MGFNAKGAVLAIEAVAVLAMTPFFLYLASMAGSEHTLELIKLRENSVLASDLLQAWAKSGKLAFYESTGDNSQLLSDLSRLSQESGKLLTLDSCIDECICETRLLETLGVTVCVGEA